MLCLRGDITISILQDDPRYYWTQSPSDLLFDVDVQEEEYIHDIIILIFLEIAINEP